jgi:hypothetical protein
MKNRFGFTGLARLTRFIAVMKICAKGGCAVGAMSIMVMVSSQFSALYAQQHIPPQQGQAANQVVQVHPPQNAPSVAVDSIAVTFAPSIQIVASSVNDTTFMVRGEASGWKQGRARYNPATNTISFYPAKPFFAG